MGARGLGDLRVQVDGGDLRVRRAGGRAAPRCSRCPRRSPGRGRPSRRPGPPACGPSARAGCWRRQLAVAHPGGERPVRVGARQPAVAAARGPGPRPTAVRSRRAARRSSTARTDGAAPPRTRPARPGRARPRPPRSPAPAPRAPRRRSRRPGRTRRSRCRTVCAHPSTVLGGRPGSEWASRPRRALGIAGIAPESPPDRSGSAAVLGPRYSADDVCEDVTGERDSARHASGADLLRAGRRRGDLPAAGPPLLPGGRARTRCCGRCTRRRIWARPRSGWRSS